MATKDSSDAGHNVAGPSLDPLVALPADDSMTLLAVVHDWLRSPALWQAKILLVGCLVEHGELVSSVSSVALDREQKEGGRLVQVEWAFSGKPVPGQLRLPGHAITSDDDCASCVAELQTKVAQMLDADTKFTFGTTLPQDVRLFAGHGGPELTWPDLAWYPDIPDCPSPKTVEALQLLRVCGTVLVATRGDFGTKMVKERATRIREYFTPSIA